MKQTTKLMTEAIALTVASLIALVAASVEASLVVGLLSLPPTVHTTAPVPPQLRVLMTASAYATEASVIMLLATAAVLAFTITGAHSLLILVNNLRDELNRQ